MGIGWTEGSVTISFLGDSLVLGILDKWELFIVRTITFWEEYL
jgi:hypothetical protein